MSESEKDVDRYGRQRLPTIALVTVMTVACAGFGWFVVGPTFSGGNDETAAVALTSPTTSTSTTAPTAAVSSAATPESTVVDTTEVGSVASSTDESSTTIDSTPSSPPSSVASTLPDETTSPTPSPDSTGPTETSELVEPTDSSVTESTDDGETTAALESTTDLPTTEAPTTDDGATTAALESTTASPTTEAPTTEAPTTSIARTTTTVAPTTTSTTTTVAPTTTAPTTTTSTSTSTTIAPTASTVTTTILPPTSTSPPVEPVVIATLPDGRPVPVTATFEDDRITLTGAVPTESDEQRVVAFALAHSLTEATVVNNLTISPDAPISGGVRIVELNSVRFGEGSEVVHPDHAQQLERIVALLNEVPTSTVHVVTNTDPRGSSERNLGISQQRADAVAAYLVSRGIDPSRITTEAAGESNVLSTEETEEAYSLNRRTEFVIFGLLDG